MCFQYIRERARTTLYLTDALALRRDVALIFDNAMKFNLPKHKVHKEAKKLGLICAAIIDTVQTKLDLNASRTIDEQRHCEYLRRERRFKLMQDLQQKGSKLLRSQEDLLLVDEPHGQEAKPKYLLQHEELFELQEHPLN